MAYYPGVHAIANTKSTTGLIQVGGSGSTLSEYQTPVDIRANLTPEGHAPILNARVLGSPSSGAPLNSIRFIVWSENMTATPHPVLTNQESLVQKYAAAGLFVIPCISCHRGGEPGIGWGDLTTAQWQNKVRYFAQNVKSNCSVVEVGNEPKIGDDWNADGTGVYYTRLREAASVLHSEGLEVISAGMPTGKDVDFIKGLHANGTTNSIFDNAIVDGVALHPYYDLAGDLSWPLNSANYDPASPEPGGGGSTTSLPHQIDWVERRRQQLNAYGHGGVVDLWVTEFGWNTRNVPGNHYAPEGHGAGQQAAKMDNAFSAFKNNAAQLRLRAACWYSFGDVATSSPIQWDQVCGIRTINTPSGGAVPWKNGILTTLGNMAFTPTPPPTDPPVVATLSAANITKNSAQLRATVNPMGSQTDYHFEYQRV